MLTFFYKVNDIDYPVEVTYKRIKKIYYRFRDNTFQVSCNRLVSKIDIIKGLDKFAKSLINRSQKKDAPIGEDYIYLFGVKTPIKESGEITFSNDEKIVYSDKSDLDKKLHKMFLNVLKNRVQYYTNLMNLPLYKVSLRNMKSRFGSNSKKTKSLHFAFVLIHYSYAVIDSVIIHELAHIVEFNHSQKFYDVVYKYCPKYDIYRKRLIRGEYCD